MTLDKGVQIADAKLRRLDGPDWNDQMTAQLLMREAKGLIEGDSNTSGGKK